jgi:hypothetical protein
MAEQAVRVSGVQDARDPPLRCAGNEHQGSLVSGAFARLSRRSDIGTDTMSHSAFWSEIQPARVGRDRSAAGSVGSQ